METFTFNVLQLSVSFLFLFSAYSSASFISEVLLDQYADKGILQKHAGYHSQAIIYVVFTFSNFFAAPILNKIGTKASLVLGALTYLMFHIGFIILNEVLLYVLSAFLGLGAAVIWTAQGKYLSLNSNEDNSSKHSGLSWAIFQMCLICGGIFLYFLFDQNSLELKDSTKNMMFGIFAGISLVGILIMALLRNVQEPQSEGTLTLPPTDSTVEIVNQESVNTGNVAQNINVEETGVTPGVRPEADITLYDRFRQTIALAVSPRMRFPLILFMYSGITQTFFGGIYPSMIGYSLGFGQNPKRNLALNMISYGCGQTLGGLIFGIFSEKTKKLGRDKIALIGTIVDFIAFSLIFVNFAEDSPYQKTAADGIITPSLILALFCGFLLGCGDSFWNTQIYSLLISTFSDCSAEAFSIFKFFQSLVCSLGFFYAKWFVLKIHLIILAACAIISTASFVLIERNLKKHIDTTAVQTEDDGDGERAEL